ncbi:MAG TPA: hypothetical protein VIS99_00550 [Terrimicrobiaceae bacterium]
MGFPDLVSYLAIVAPRYTAEVRILQTIVTRRQAQSFILRVFAAGDLETPLPAL